MDKFTLHEWLDRPGNGNSWNLEAYVLVDKLDVFSSFSHFGGESNKVNVDGRVQLVKCGFSDLGLSEFSPETRILLDSDCGEASLTISTYYDEGLSEFELDNDRDYYAYYEVETRSWVFDMVMLSDKLGRLLDLCTVKKQLLMAAEECVINSETSLGVEIGNEPLVFKCSLKFKQWSVDRGRVAHFSWLSVSPFRANVKE